MTAFGADVPIAVSRIHGLEIIAFDAIGAAHDFLNHFQHPAGRLPFRGDSLIIRQK